MLRSAVRFPCLLLCASLGCGDNSASDGSSSGGTGETGAEEGGAAESNGEEPGPNGPGCNEPWEGWWEGAGADASRHDVRTVPEGNSQHGRRRASARLDTHLVPRAPPVESPDDFRSTLISEPAVLSTGRNLSVSWCLGSIEPNPQGPGAFIDEELDALNLERYELFRAELERATRTWERHSRMNFVHLASLDDRRKPSGGMCDDALEEVWFRAQTRECNEKYQGQTNAGGENEFDPAFASPENPDGSLRVLCIAKEFLDAAKTRIPWYASHESGHVVGLHHEHIRWDQGENVGNNCDENDPYVPILADRTLTPADSWSVMGYPECVGMAVSDGASPHDMLGAYYTFNWTERRVRDMAPQTGGRDQRLWSGDNRPGVLWYLPFSDRLLEWRFGIEQPGPLTFDPIEHCLDHDCSLTDSRGHWHPVMGQFSGTYAALDVFMYGADDTADLLLRNDGSGGFETIAAPAPGRAIPVVGNFGGGTRDQILWYRPGPATEALWNFDEAGGHESLVADVDQDGWRIPLTGHFRSRTHWTDIIWFDPRDATVDTWLFNHDFSVSRSGPGSVELLGVVDGTEYLPIVGNFDGDNRTDVFWYTPGVAPDWLWLSIGNQVAAVFDSYEFAVDGEYHPITGDFDGDGDDDLLWYRPAVETAGGNSWIWYFDGASVDTHPVLIQGDYVPYVEDFDSDGCTDILWYDPVAPDNNSPVWRCIPNQKTFSCGDHLPAPKKAYPIGFATGGY
jgi:hypothetical protein